MSMKYLIKSVCIGILNCICILYATNAPPHFNNISIEFIEDSQSVSFKYDLYDSDGDSIEVSIKIYCKDTLFVFSPHNSITGDIGWPIMPGLSKEITWNIPDILMTSNANIYSSIITADDKYKVDVRSVIQGIDTIRILNHLEKIVGERNIYWGVDHLENTKQNIESVFLEGQLVTERQYFSYDNYLGSNIIGNQYGSERNEVILLTAHIDAISPGADDNASGLVGVLEAARVLSQFNFKNSIRYVGFDLEEEGLVGSINYVQNALSPDDNIIGVLNMDMIGYYSDEPYSQNLPEPELVQLLFPNEYQMFAENEFKGDFLLSLANENSSTILTQFDICSHQFVPELKVFSLVLPDVIAGMIGGSDHVPFWATGYSALFLCDGTSFRNPYYHSEMDVISTLNLPVMCDVIRAVVATVFEVAEVQNECTFESELLIFEISTSEIPSFIQRRDDRMAYHYSLAQNYPNPFNPTTRIDYSLSSSNYTTLSIYNIQGQLLRTLISEHQRPGHYSVLVDGNELGSGVYYYQLQSGQYTKSMKFILIK